MARHAKVDERHGTAELDINPFCSDAEHAVRRHQIPSQPMPADVALQLVRDELMLDGNARLNLATFVTTWMEPQAARLMAAAHPGRGAGIGAAPVGTAAA